MENYLYFLVILFLSDINNQNTKIVYVPNPADKADFPENKDFKIMYEKLDEIEELSKKKQLKVLFLLKLNQIHLVVLINFQMIIIYHQNMKNIIHLIIIIKIIIIIMLFPKNQKKKKKKKKKKEKKRR